MLRNATTLSVSLCAALLLGCSSSSTDSGGTSESGSVFDNGFFRTGYLFEDFETGVNDSVTATLSEDTTTITENGNASDGNIFVITHDLDALGQLLKRTITDEDGSISLTESYTYGANGYPATQLRVSEDNSERRDIFEWTADNKIDLYTRTYLNAEGELESNYTYDFMYNNGVLASMREEQVPNPDGNFTEFTYTVDANGRVIERAQYNSSGELQRTTMWEYDTDGNQAVQTRFGADGNMTSRLTTTYVATDKQVYNRNLFQRILAP